MILCFLSIDKLKQCDWNIILKSIETSFFESIFFNVLVMAWYKVDYKMLEQITWSLNFQIPNHPVIDPKPRCNVHIFFFASNKYAKFLPIVFHPI